MPSRGTRLPEEPFDHGSAGWGRGTAAAFEGGSSALREVLQAQLVGTVITVAPEGRAKSDALTSDE